MLGYKVPASRRKRDDAEKAFWISYADLMTAMMVLFLVIMSVSLLVVIVKMSDVEVVPKSWLDYEQLLHHETFDQWWCELLEYQKTQTVVDEQAQQLAQQEEKIKQITEQLQNEIKQNEQAKSMVDKDAVLRQARSEQMQTVLVRLQEDANRIKSCNITVEQQHKDAITVMFSSADITRVAMFDSNSYKIRDQDQKCIREFVPSIFDQVYDNRWFNRVGVEGFTDTSGTYLHNLDLSLQRAKSVVCSIMSPDKTGSYLQDDLLAFVQEKFLVGGFSFNSAKPNKDESRRVELRLDFKTIEEYQATLNQEIPMMQPAIVNKKNIGNCPAPTPPTITIAPTVPVFVTE